MATTSSNEKQLNLLLKLICESVNEKTNLNSKLLRDILDVVEGLMRGIVNSKGNYNHQTLKLNCLYKSDAASNLIGKLSKFELLKKTHREHAIPLKIVLDKLYSLKNVDNNMLHRYLDNKLVSVLITKEEQLLLDSMGTDLKSKMPIFWDGKNIFARFEQIGITIYNI